MFFLRSPHVFFRSLRHFRSTSTRLGLLGHPPLTVREMNSAKNVGGRNLFKKNARSLEQKCVLEGKHKITC